MDLLQEITFYLGLTFRKPVNYIASRWLSVHDTTLAFSYMEYSYTLYYNAMVRRNAKVVFKKIYNTKKNGKVLEGMDEKQKMWDKRQTYVNECNQKIF